MHCLLVDDNTKTSFALGKLLQEVKEISYVHAAFHPYQVPAILLSYKIDVVFIRVRLWDYSLFLQLPQMSAVVFLWGGKDNLTNTPGTVVPYRMREPYNIEEITRQLGKLKTDPIIESPNYFFVRFAGHCHRLFFGDIEMIETLQIGYVKIWTRYTAIMVSDTIPELLKRLPADQFVRVSDTLALPMVRVKTIESDEYVYRGRKIKLTYRFAAAARKELEQNEH